MKSRLSLIIKSICHIIHVYLWCVTDVLKIINFIRFIIYNFTSLSLLD